jgi:hypothetical protein
MQRLAFDRVKVKLSSARRTRKARRVDQFSREIRAFPANAAGDAALSSGQASRRQVNQSSQPTKSTNQINQPLDAVGAIMGFSPMKLSPIPG